MLTIYRRWFKTLCFLVVFIFSFTCFFSITPPIAYAAQESAEQAESADSAAQELSVEQTADTSETDEPGDTPTESSDASAQTTDSIAEQEAVVSQDSQPLQTDSRLLEAGERLGAISVNDFGSQYFPEDRKLSAEEYQNLYTEKTEDDNGNGTIEFYFSPIRYQDEYGKWKRIDTSLVKTDIGYSTRSTEAAVALSESGSSDSLASVEKDGKSISFRPIDGLEENIQTARLIQSNGNTVKSSNYNRGQTYFGVRHNSILANNTDIILRPLSNGIKEEIILDRPTDIEEFSFELTLSGMYPVLRADGNLFFIGEDTDKVEAYSPAPFMHDSAEEQQESYEVDVRVEKKSQGKYIYTMIPDKEWLADSRRVYPVVVDPSVTFHDATMYETFISNKYPTTNYYADTHVKVGNSDALGVSRGLYGILQFKSSIGSNRHISSATFKAYQDYTGASSPAIGLYQVNNSYNNETVTWNTRPAISTSAAATKTVQATGWYEWNITAMVRNWYSGAADWARFCMRNTNEDANMYKRFRADNYGDGTTYSPRLVVSYVTAPSVPTVSVSPATWTNGSITVSWSGVTPGSGATLSDVQYSVTSETSGYSSLGTAASGSKTLPNLPAGANHSLWVRAKNSAGVYSSPKKVTYSRDATAPTAPTSVTVSPSSWTSGNITVSHSGASDALSGIAYYQYGISSSASAAPSAYTNIQQNSFTIAPAQSSGYVWVRAVDKAGNVSAAKCSSTAFHRDTSAPPAPAGVTVSPASWTNGSIGVTFQPVTDASDISKYQYALTSSDTAPAASAYVNTPALTGSTFSITPAEGQQYVWVRAVNGANLAGAGACSSTKYLRDVTPPNSPSTVRLIYSDGAADSKMLIWDGVSDTLSGVAQLAYKIDSGAYITIPVENNNFASGQISFISASENVTLRITDGAGNTREVSASPEIAAPSGFTATSMVNHAVKLMWQASATAGVVYDVYKAVGEGEFTKVAEGLTGNYWFDYNIENGTSYRYKMRATLTRNGETLESADTAEETATPVSADILSIQLGQRSYETLLSYDITSGTGAVHPLSGNLLYRKEDVNTNSAAHSISFTRTYNSLGGYVSPLGTNWDHSLNIMLLKTFDSTGAETGVLYKAGDGAIYTFSKNADGTYTRPSGLYAELTINSDGLYVLTFKDKTVYAFNKSNQIASIADNIGNTTTFLYNARGNLTSVSNSLGDELTLAYYTTPGKADLIERVTAGGVTCDYVYDDNSNRLIKAQKPVDDSNEWITEEYAYNEGGRLSKVTTAVDGEYLFAYGEGGKAVSVTDPKNRSFAVTYQTEGASYIVTSGFAGKTISQTYSADMKMTSLSDNGRVTSYTYDGDFNVTSTTAPGNITTSATYDSRGNVLTATNEMGKVTNYTYDSGKDVPASVSEPWNGSTRKVTRYTYNSKDLPTTVFVVGSRQKTFHYYDSSWNLIKTVTVTGDGAEALSYEAAENITAGNGLFVTITEYEYDSARRVVRTTRKDGDKTRVSTQSYDNATNQVTTETADGVTTQYEYTVKSDEPEKVTTNDGDNAPTDETTEFDHMGNAIGETDAIGNTSTTEYDALGRVIKETAADGIVTETVYGDKSDGTSYTLVTVKNGSDVQKKSLTVTDKWGSTILEGTCRVNGDESGTPYETSAGTVVLIDYTENTYDAAGRLVSSTDRYGLTTSHTYDAAGRVLSETLSKGTDSETTAYTYDDAGNRLTETLPDGTTTTYTYDVLERVLTETVSKGSDSLTPAAYTYDIVDGTQLRRELRDAKNRVISWTDNAFGELAEEKRGTATTAYEYNNDGQLTKSTLTDASKPGESAVTEYEYTGVNQTKKKYSPNHYIEYVYDDNGKVTSERVTKDGGASWQAIANVYDNANGNVTSTTRSGETLTFGYSGDKQLRDTITYGTGDAVKYVYNDRGDIAAVKLNDVLAREYLYTSGHVSEIRDYTAANAYTSQTFAYDWKDRVTAVSYKDAAGAEQEGYTLTYGDGDRIAAETTTYCYSPTPVTMSRAYEYDWLGRLTKETVNGTETSYTYDAVGNRTGMTAGGATLAYTYDDGDRLLDIKNGNTVLSSYTYDVSGNRTSATENGVATAYTYDAANQLTKAQRGAAVLGEYTYDAEGQRLTKTINGTTTAYVYDGIDLLYAKEGDTVTEKNVLEDDGSMILSYRGEIPCWYRQDIRGSVTNIVDGSGAVKKSYTYDAYGNTTASADVFENHHAYTGAYMDDETGLYYLSSRYYDPKTGSFTSADSYRGEGEGFWQLYAYCEGDPVNGTDLSGKFTYSKKDRAKWKIYSQRFLRAKKYILRDIPYSKKKDRQRLESFTTIAKRNELMYYDVTYYNTRKYVMREYRRLTGALDLYGIFGKFGMKYLGSLFVSQLISKTISLAQLEEKLAYAINGIPKGTVEFKEYSIEGWKIRRNSKGSYYYASLY